jgi:pimeloyl-ACP methyl ester carboxylesterase
MPPLPFDRISSPALVVHGEIDLVVPFAHGERSARGIATAEFFAAPGGEHVCLFTHFDEVRMQVDTLLHRARWQV